MLRIALLGVIALLFHLVINHVVSLRARYKFVRQNGLQSPPIYEPQSLLGLSLFREAKRAAAEYKSLESNIERFYRHGNTYSANMIGKSLIMTMDPENIKAVLSTRFNDFGLGQRLLAFGPFIGKGIFTSDGAHWEHSRVRMPYA